MRTFFIACCLCLSVVACTAPAEEAAPDAGAVPDAAPDAPTANLDRFDADMRAAESALGMPAGWADWMIARKNKWAPAYLIGLEGKTDWRIRVLYDNPIAYSPAWASEDEHMAALKKMLELQYPGWTFTFGINLPNPDRTIYLGNHDGSYADGTSVHLMWEGILAHEFGHTVGLWHHYDDTTLTETPDTEPPGERPCIMSRNGMSWGQTESFLLHLGAPNADDLINAAVDDLNQRYPAHWPNVSSFTGSKTGCPSNECTQDKR